MKELSFYQVFSDDDASSLSHYFWFRLTRVARASIPLVCCPRPPSSMVVQMRRGAEYQSESAKPGTLSRFPLERPRPPGNVDSIFRKECPVEEDLP